MKWWQLGQRKMMRSKKSTCGEKRSRKREREETVRDDKGQNQRQKRIKKQET